MFALLMAASYLIAPGWERLLEPSGVRDTLLDRMFFLSRPGLLLTEVDRSHDGTRTISCRIPCLHR